MSKFILTIALIYIVFAIGASAAFGATNSSYTDKVTNSKDVRVVSN